jgi:hypothetical protein
MNYQSIYSTPKIETHFNPNADIALYHGDVNELLPTLPDESISLIVTSPPYNLGKEYEERVPMADYLKKQTKVITQLYRVLKNSGSICWQVGNFVEKGEIYPLDIFYYDIFKKLNFKLRNRIIKKKLHKYLMNGRSIINKKCFLKRKKIKMIVAGIYSFNNGKKVIESQYPNELAEVKEVIEQVDSISCKQKESQEKTKIGRLLYSLIELNKAFKNGFAAKSDWKSYRIPCEYPTKYYVSGYQPSENSKTAYREMDFMKNRVGIEVQFGKYAFMVYNVCAKMTIFQKKSIINVGIEIVPVKEFAHQMSSGVSYFEQFVWDLEQRGVSNIDIPVLILGVAA